MDSPTGPRPREAAEQKILDELVPIREKLLLIKGDYSTHMRTDAVMSLYEQIMAKVGDLTSLRPGSPVGEGTQLDRFLESCFQLLSLCFMTIGHNSEAPATFALTSILRRLFDHLLESSLYSSRDLDRLAGTLEQLNRAVTLPGKCRPAAYVVALLAVRVGRLQDDMVELRKRLDELEGDMPDVWEKLISILRAVSMENTRSYVSVSEVRRLKKELCEIDAQRVDGNFVSDDGQIRVGNETVSKMLAKCQRWTDTVLEGQGDIPQPFQHTYRTLRGIRNHLEKLLVTKEWSMRETDLYDYQQQLEQLDETRMNGQWIDDDGQPAEYYTQWTLVYLIRRSYALLYLLLATSEPVSEALLPMLNQLNTLKQCLEEVKNAGGVESARELYPYMMKLQSIEKFRKDGLFVVGNDTPDGQRTLAELLDECIGLTKELGDAAAASMAAKPLEAALTSGV